MKNTRHQENRFKVRGFSLLELMVVMVLLGIMMTLMVVSIRSLAVTKIKEEVTRIAGLFSEVYAKAAISGITHRINFNLDENEYWVESRVAEAGDIAPDLGYEELMVTLRAKLKDADNKSKLEKLLPQYKAIEGIMGEKYKLPKELALYGAWTDQMKDVARTGLVSIYFFSGGYTQSSFVSIAEKGDEKDSSIYIALSPLTAAVSTNYGEPTTASLLEGEGEK